MLGRQNSKIQQRQKHNREAADVSKIISDTRAANVSCAICNCYDNQRANFYANAVAHQDFAGQNSKYDDVQRNRVCNRPDKRLPSRHVLCSRRARKSCRPRASEQCLSTSGPGKHKEELRRQQCVKNDHGVKAYHRGITRLNETSSRFAFKVNRRPTVISRGVVGCQNSCQWGGR